MDKEQCFCEVCGREIGTMSIEAYKARDRKCEDCIEEEDYWERHGERYGQGY